jgi:hypothetical protein
VLTAVSSVQQVQETAGFHGLSRSFAAINTSAACPFFGTIFDLRVCSTTEMNYDRSLSLIVGCLPQNRDSQYPFLELELEGELDGAGAADLVERIETAIRTAGA